ncbi:mRNA splicing factor PRP38 (nucleomorph) [Lotharella oceanica]|uniref:Pre-mRNA-splicing factor 38 n=1 Tax=Lotharella oceanica TaxID=641309 RepID=A0A060DAR3_9EUKA|nr:mRNA splicing factor PRP38 [Lotharella oceanica]|mmetsp:Transcript_4369/g.8750  ORF Transcript_4369/g.8750 Transcript_4369/m.8750 type:complete len:156 (+) Transcript_4369:87-554(+)
MKTEIFFNFNKTQIAMIKKTRFWMIHCISLGLTELIDFAYRIKNIGGFISNNKYPCDFLCIFLRFVELKPSINILKNFLLDNHSTCLKILALLYIRIFFSKENILNFYKPFNNGKQIIMIKIGKNTIIPTTLKNIIKILISKKHFYGFQLPPMRL